MFQNWSWSQRSITNPHQHNYSPGITNYYLFFKINIYAMHTVQFTIIFSIHLKFLLTTSTRNIKNSIFQKFVTFHLL